MAQLIEMSSREPVCTVVKVNSKTTTADGGRTVMEFIPKDHAKSSFRLAVNDLEAQRVITALSKALLDKAERRQAS